MTNLRPSNAACLFDGQARALTINRGSTTGRMLFDAIALRRFIRQTTDMVRLLESYEQLSMAMTSNKYLHVRNRCFRTRPCPQKVSPVVVIKDLLRASNPLARSCGMLLIHRIVIPTLLDQCWVNLAVENRRVKHVVLDRVRSHCRNEVSTIYWPKEFRHRKRLK